MSQHEPFIDIFLQPGEFYFGDRDTRIRTVLGSCVSITLWHPQRRIGGMCHYMLPARNRKQAGTLDGRYADEAMLLFMREILRAGSSPVEYQVKLFGGGRMFQQHENTTHSRCDVSYHNQQTAYRLLDAYGLKLYAEHTGGFGHRNVVFDINSGDVWMRQLPVLSLVKP